MKTHAKQPVNNRPVQAKASNQASEKNILQQYKQQAVAQREALDEEEPAQTKADTAQLEELGEEDEEPAQRKANNTGLPDNLKSGVENLSGHAMDDVKVHYNSAKPAELQAHAYAQGTDIHVAPGQEKHLPHEAWHVAQQKQGRVKPTRQMKGKTPINDDTGLEKEADVMGAKAAQMQPDEEAMQLKSKHVSTGEVIQQKTEAERSDKHQRIAKAKTEIAGKTITDKLKNHMFRGQPTKDTEAFSANKATGMHAYTDGDFPTRDDDGENHTVDAEVQGNPNKVHTINWRWSTSSSDDRKSSTMFPQWMPAQHVIALVAGGLASKTDKYIKHGLKFKVEKKGGTAYPVPE